MTEAEVVLSKAEELREKLNKVSEGKSFTDPQVVLVSKMLDVLLNEYHNLMNEIKSEHTKSNFRIG